MITQGDQYYLPITITDSEGQTITPETTSGIIFQLGDNSYVYPNGGLYYDNGEWKALLTSDQTNSLPPTVLAQLKVKFDTTPESILVSQIKRIPIQKSIIKGTFNGSN